MARDERDQPAPTPVVGTGPSEGCKHPTERDGGDGGWGLAPVQDTGARLAEAEALLREEVTGCVCIMVDRAAIGRRDIKPEELCGDCWWCRVRAFLTRPTPTTTTGAA